MTSENKVLEIIADIERDTKSRMKQMGESSAEARSIILARFFAVLMAQVEEFISCKK